MHVVILLLQGLMSLKAHVALSNLRNDSVTLLILGVCTHSLEYPPGAMEIPECVLEQMAFTGQQGSLGARYCLTHSQCHVKGCLPNWPGLSFPKSMVKYRPLRMRLLMVKEGLRSDGFPSIKGIGEAGMVEL